VDEYRLAGDVADLGSRGLESDFPTAHEASVSGALPIVQTARDGACVAALDDLNLGDAVRAHNSTVHTFDRFGWRVAVVAGGGRPGNRVPQAAKSSSQADGRCRTLADFAGRSLRTRTASTSWSTWSRRRAVGLQTACADQLVIFDLMKE
jgi:hypothetical protein